MKDRGGGEGTGSRSNNLVYTKRQKQINAISTHETTEEFSIFNIYKKIKFLKEDFTEMK